MPGFLSIDGWVNVECPDPVWPRPWQPPALSPDTMRAAWLPAKVPVTMTVALTFTVTDTNPQLFAPQVTLTVAMRAGTHPVTFSTTVSFLSKFSIAGAYLHTGRYRG